MAEFIKALDHPMPCRAYASDHAGMEWADVCVLVLPSGKSSHMEAGWMKGKGKPVYVLLAEDRPELSYKLFDKICISLEELADVLGVVEARVVG